MKMQVLVAAGVSLLSLAFPLKSFAGATTFAELQYAVSAAASGSTVYVDNDMEFDSPLSVPDGKSVRELLAGATGVETEAEVAAQEAAEAAAQQAAQANAAFGLEASQAPVVPAPVAPVIPQPVVTTTGPHTSSNRFVEKWSFVVTDMNAVPRELCSPDEAKIRALMQAKKAEGYKAAQLVVPGIRFTSAIQVCSR